MDAQPLTNKVESLGLAQLERMQFSCELHDGLLQHVIGAKYAMEGIKHRFAERPPTLEELSQVEAMLIRAIRDGRDWIGELRGDHDRPDLPLRHSLEQWVREVRQTQPGVTLRLNIENNPDIDSLSKDLRIAVFRIVQESVRNSYRHAKPSKISIDLSVDSKHQLQIAIRDDGCGFLVASIPTDHYGLAIMQTRAQSVGGVFAIDSQPGHGTQIRVRIPLESPSP